MSSRASGEDPHGVAEADGANVRIGLRAVDVGAAAERLCARVQLHVRLDADNRLEAGLQESHGAPSSGSVSGHDGRPVTGAWQATTNNASGKELYW